MMSSIIKAGEDVTTRMAMMQQVVLQDNDFNQDSNDAALLNDEQYNTLS
jgi:hypothetical protein